MNHDLFLFGEIPISCTSHANQRQDGQCSNRAATASGRVWVPPSPSLNVERACLRHRSGGTAWLGHEGGCEGRRVERTRPGRVYIYRVYLLTYLLPVCRGASVTRRGGTGCCGFEAAGSVASSHAKNLRSFCSALCPSHEIRARSVRSLPEAGLRHFRQCLNPRSITDPCLARSPALPARRQLSWHSRNPRCTLPNQSQQSCRWCLRCWPHC